MVNLDSLDSESLGEVVSWASSFFTTNGYSLESKNPEIILKTPWSLVLCFTTTEGKIYLKQTPKELALEASVFLLLESLFLAPVPKVIAQNQSLNCFLTEDAGSNLRSVLKQKFSLDLLCKAVDTFSFIQIETAPNIDSFFELGVPDYRLDKLALLFHNLISQSEILLEDGLVEQHLYKLQALSPLVSDLCKELAAFEIMPMLVQPDFNENNMLINIKTERLCSVDLGEIVISHPFFSLINFMFQIQKHYDIKAEDKVYKQVKDAYFKNFLKFASLKNLESAFDLANSLWAVYGALSIYRVMFACDKSKFFATHKGKLAESLKECIARLS